LCSSPSKTAWAVYPTRVVICRAMLLPTNDPRFSSVARLATDRRSRSALEWSTRRVLRAILPRTNARPARKTATAASPKPGPVATTRKLTRPTAMLVARATRTEVRSVYHPARGAHTDWARTYPFRTMAISA
jgi:hypothetical protein